MLSDALECSQIRSYPFRSFQLPPDPFKCRGAACVLPLWVRGRVVCGMSCQVGHCAPVCARKHFACKSSQIHSDAHRLSHMLSFASRCSHMLSDALRCPHMLAYPIRCCQMLSDPLKSVQISPDILKCRGAACFLPLWVRRRVVCGMSRQVGHCAPVSILHANPPRSTQMHPDALICSHVLSYAVNCYQMRSHALRSSQMFPNALRRCRVLPDVPKCSEMFPEAVLCSQMLSDALACSQILSCALRCSQIISYALKCCQMLPSALR